MGIKTNKIQEMRVAIIALLIAYVASQAPVTTKKWLCCKEANNMGAPRWDTACPKASRRMQVWLNHIAQDNWQFQRESYKLLNTQLLQTVLTTMPQEEDYKPLLPTNVQLTLKDGYVSLTTLMLHAHPPKVLSL